MSRHRRRHAKNQFGNQTPSGTSAFDGKEMHGLKLSVAPSNNSLSLAKEAEAKGYFYAAALRYLEAGEKEDAIRCARVHATDKLNTAPYLVSAEIPALIKLMQTVGDTESLNQLLGMSDHFRDVFEVYTSPTLPKGWVIVKS